MKSAAIRKAAERARKKSQGLKRGEFWLPEKFHAEAERCIARLLRASKKSG